MAVFYSDISRKSRSMAMLAIPRPQYQYFLLQPPTLSDQMHERLCQRIALPAGLSSILQGVLPLLTSCPSRR